MAPYLLDELQKSQRNLQSDCVGTAKVSSIFHYFSIFVQFLMCILYTYIHYTHTYVIRTYIHLVALSFHLSG